MRFRPAMELLCYEAALALAYETWLGATYLGGLAGEWGLPAFYLTLTTALPFLGAMGQLFAVARIHRLRSPKRATLWLAGSGRAMWGLAILTALVWALQSHSVSPFPRERWFALAAIFAGAAAWLGSCGTVAWFSWMKGLTPPSFYGRFLGRRHAFMTFALIGANLTAAALIAYRPNGQHVGYLVLGLLAVLCAFGSVTLLGRVPDAPAPADAIPVHFRATLRNALHDKAFMRLVLGAAFFHFCVQFASTYFGYYFTRDLQLSMSRVAVWVAVSNFAGVFTAAYWGRHVDKGRARSVMRVCALLISLSPLPYLWSRSFLVTIAPFEYAVNGLAWTGFTLAFTTMLLRQCPARSNTVYFSLNVAFTGLASSLGVFCGGRVLAWLGGDGDALRLLFAIGGVLRLFGTWVLLRLFPSPQELDVLPRWRLDELNFASRLWRFYIRYRNGK